MGHDHDDHDEFSELSDVQLRVRALETVLTEKGYVDPAALDAIVETYERRVGPRNGARVVAKAWVDPDYRAWLLADATEAVASLGYTGRQGEHLHAVENTPDVHHLVVCTLCSCYPWPVLGLPPVWYKSPAYRSRAVADPRGVLADFGVELPADDADPGVGLDGRAALPRRADATARHGRARRGGARRPRHARLDDRHRAGAGAVNGPHDLGGADGFGPVVPEPDEPVFHARGRPGPSPSCWPRVAAADGTSTWSRFARESIPPARYLASSYYDIWATGVRADGRRARAGDGRGAGRRPRHRARRRRSAGCCRPTRSGPMLASRSGSTERPTTTPARFAVGDAVRARVMHPAGHTRLPRYVRGRPGTVEAVHGCHVYPDHHAHGGGEDPQWLYTVVFAGPRPVG